MSAELMLESSEPSLLIIEERTNKHVVVGVPHHAPAGTATLPCAEHEDSDENAGFLGRYVAEELDCCSIIACNYVIDVNKFFRSDYAMQIARWNPKVLIEIHGHGGKKAKFNVEISSGSDANDRYSNPMATKLTAIIQGMDGLKHLSISGEYSKLRFKASGSVTISDGRWVAYHIELPPELRKPSDAPGGKPPAIGYKFCDAIIKVLREIHAS